MMNDPAMPVTFVPSEVEATKKFFGIATWPTDIGHVDLGGRVLDIIPIPGHNAVSVAFYDHNTGVLLSGDSLYPGRLYVQDFAAFQASTERLLSLSTASRSRTSSAITSSRRDTPFLDYPVGTTLSTKRRA